MGNELKRIYDRDRCRLNTLGYNTNEFKLVYLAYHSDNSDRDWLQDILLMTSEEKKLFNRHLPNYKAKMINKGKLHSYKDSKELW